MKKYIKLDSSWVLILNKNKYLIQVGFKNGFFVLELSLETVFKYIKDSQEDFKWPKVFLMHSIVLTHPHIVMTLTHLVIDI